MKNNILGVDLKIDQEYIAKCVREVVELGITDALGTKDKIVSEVVTQLLNQKVDSRDGTPDKWNYSSSPTLVEYELRKTICDVVKEEIKSCIEERRKELSEMIRTELSRKATLNKFVDSFINNTCTMLENNYHTTIDIKFDKKNED